MVGQKEHYEGAKELYERCLADMNSIPFDYMRFYLSKDKLSLYTDRCSAHVNRALDDIGDFEFTTGSKTGKSIKCLGNTVDRDTGPLVLTAFGERPNFLYPTSYLSIFYFVHCIPVEKKGEECLSLNMAMENDLRKQQALEYHAKGRRGRSK